MTQLLSFRPYAQEDQNECLAIFHSNCPKFFASHECDGFLKYLQEARNPYFVVTDANGRILACGGYVIENGTGELAWGMVGRESHRQGIGRFLFKKRLESIEIAGAAAVIMDTSQHSLGFYQGLGFEVISMKPDAYGPGLDRYDLRLALI
jgi:ribosomal protein S18 acetylase RimI-like enzyme